MSKIRPLLGLALLIVLILFVLMNLRPAYIHILVGQVEMPMGLAILLAAGLGAGTASALRLLRQFRRPPPR